MRRVFLGPADRPLAEAVAETLLREAPRLGRAADLSDRAVIVPTRRAGRRLTEALARAALAGGLGGVLTPLITTPDGFFRACARPADTLPAPAARLVMARAMAGLGPARLAPLFPRPPEPWNEEKLAPAADAILRARHTLGDAADTPNFSAVAARRDCPEPERWRALADVESAYLSLLESLGHTDALTHRAQTVAAPAVPGTVRAITLAAVGSASPALRRLLQNTGLPLTTLVDNESEHAEDYDEFGAPLTPGVSPWPDAESFARTVHLPVDPAALTRHLVVRLSGAEAPDAAVTVILADPALDRAVASAFEACGAPATEAEGSPLSEHPHAVILRDWSAFLREPDWDRACALFRRPAFAEKLAPDTTPAQLAADADKVGELLLPHDITALRETPQEHAAITRTRPRLAELDRLRREFERETFPEAVTGFITRLGPGGTDHDTEFAETLQRLVRETETFAARFGRLDTARRLALVLTRLGETAAHPAAAADRPAIRGWLELAWEDAPHLVVAGLNEGRVPESVSSDAFLPGSFCQKLGLPDDDSRLASDMRALARAIRRRDGGRGLAEVYAPRHDASGEPLRPSRLLTTGSGDELPSRVLRLYAEPPPGAPEPARTRAWRWTPRVDPAALRRVAGGLPPTAFKDYLECPLRFYLKRVAGARPIKPDLAEPDAGAFGDLVHGALAAYALDPAAAALTDEAAIRLALRDFLAAEATRRHGPNPSLAALVQRHAAEARLTGFARVQAGLRQEGWYILLAEEPFKVTLYPEGDDTRPFVIEGRFDRIDRHADGRLRVLDYKTADAGTPPDKAHLVRADSAAAWPDFAYTEAGPATAKGALARRRWTNLQLPLYVEAALVRPDLAGAPFPEVAYAVLPASAADAALAPWSEYTRELHRDALACAAGVARAVRELRFRPGPKPPAHDDFAELLGEDAEAAVDWETFGRRLAETQEADR